MNQSSHGSASDSMGFGIRRFAWRHPEWWPLTLSLLAWIVLLREGADPVHGPHAMHDGIVGARIDWFMSAGAHAVVMIGAMMLPLVVTPIRTAAFRSLWARRHLAIAEFLAAYIAIWSLVYVASAAIRPLLVPRQIFPLATVAIGFSIAAVWQFTSHKRRALRVCSRGFPLAPEGWPAHRDCLRYGVNTAAACLTSCWAIMLVPMLVVPNVPLMAGVTTVCLAERYARYPGYRPATLAALLGALAVGCAVIARVQGLP